MPKPASRGRAASRLPKSGISAPKRKGGIHTQAIALPVVEGVTWNKDLIKSFSSKVVDDGMLGELIFELDPETAEDSTAYIAALAAGTKKRHSVLSSQLTYLASVCEEIAASARKSDKSKTVNIAMQKAVDSVRAAGSDDGSSTESEDELAGTLDEFLRRHKSSIAFADFLGVLEDLEQLDSEDDEHEAPAEAIEKVECLRRILLAGDVTRAQVLDAVATHQMEPAKDTAPKSPSARVTGKKRSALSPPRVSVGAHSNKKKAITSSGGRPTPSSAARRILVDADSTDGESSGESDDSDDEASSAASSEGEHVSEKKVKADRGSAAVRSAVAERSYEARFSAPHDETLATSVLEHTVEIDRVIRKAPEAAQVSFSRLLLRPVSALGSRPASAATSKLLVDSIPQQVKRFERMLAEGGKGADVITDAVGMPIFAPLFTDPDLMAAIGMGEDGAMRARQGHPSHQSVGCRLLRDAEGQGPTAHQH
jgi:hypothetical protein